MHALMRAAANATQVNATQVVQSPPPDIPIADANLATYRHAILYHNLPGVDPYIQARSSDVPMQLVWLVGKLVTNQCQAQDEECNLKPQRHQSPLPATGTKQPCVTCVSCVASTMRRISLNYGITLLMLDPSKID
ncbi:hypothetical protein ACA910_006330 [Epithemia clementina (nom. ined.)]